MHFVGIFYIKFIRIDDLSWGTKGLGSTGGGDSDIENEFKWRKFVFVIKFKNNV